MTGHHPNIGATVNTTAAPSKNTKPTRAMNPRRFKVRHHLERVTLCVSQSALNGHTSKPSAEHSDEIRTSVRKHVERHLSAFGRAVCGIWPIKPALHLAQLEECSERAAEYQINGERKPSANAIHAVVGKMLNKDG